jgi:hypothetical protein
LTYAWADNGTPIGTEALTSAVLPAGSHEIDVEVSDGTDSDVAAATIEVITPAQAAALIAGVVVDSSLSPNRKQPLLASLAAVEASFARGNFTAALNQLRAFELEVSQIAGRADRVLVQDLVTASRTLTNAVGSRRK